MTEVWKFRGVEYPYDEATSREIEERRQQAKSEEMRQLSDLEYYDFAFSDVAVDEPEFLTDTR